jgi:hypothetical protein
MPDASEQIIIDEFLALEEFERAILTASLRLTGLLIFSASWSSCRCPGPL